MLFPKRRHNLEPVHLCHHDVRDHQVGVGVLKERRALLAIARYGGRRPEQ
jgi:hypothetical protein